MTSYVEQPHSSLTQGTSARYIPSAPKQNRLALLSALKQAHSELLEPPEIVKNDPERMKRWKGRVRRQVDWDGVEDEEGYKREVEEKKRKEVEGGGGEKGIMGGKKTRRVRKKDVFIQRKKQGGADEVVDESDDEEEQEEKHEAGPDENVKQTEESKDDEEFPFITIGLIGQPNVGKSSLLNALLGRKVVRASRTPGKTK